MLFRDTFWLVIQERVNTVGWGVRIVSFSPVDRRPLAGDARWDWPISMVNARVTMVINRNYNDRLFHVNSESDICRMSTLQPVMQELLKLKCIMHSMLLPAVQNPIKTRYPFILNFRSLM
jgi:hypothetical protein